MIFLILYTETVSNQIMIYHACHITVQNSLEEFALNLFKVIMLPFLLVQGDPNEF